MSDANFRVFTSADLSGMRALSNMLSDIERKSKSITDMWAGARLPGGTQSVASGGGTAYAVSTANTGTPQRRQQRAGLAGNQQYNLNTPAGLFQWMENVYEPEAGVLAQMAQGFGQKLGYGSPARVRRSAPMSTTVPVTRTAPMSQRAINSWFAGLSSQTGTMSPEARNAYVQTAFSENQNSAIRDFYTQYGAQLGAPTGAPPSPPAGGGGNGGSSNGGGFGSEVGMALGTFAKKSLPFLSVVAAADYTKNQITSGYSLWQQSSAPIDALSHSLSTTATNVEQFRQSIVNAGAQFGQTLQQSAQSAQLLTQSFGNLSQQSLTNLVGSTARFGFVNGLSPQQSAQIMASSAQLGITEGYGSTLSATQFQGMLGNATLAAGMQGRQGPFYTGLLSAANNVVSANGVLSNPAYFASMYAQSVKTMGGMRGGNLFSTLNNSVMNARGTTQGILFAAMNNTLGGKISSQNIVSLLSAQQGGLSSFVPGSHVTIGKSLYGYLKNSGMSDTQQVLLSSQYFGGNVNQAQEWLNNGGNFGTNPISTSNNQPVWRGLYDYLQTTMAHYGVSQSDYGTAVAPLAIATHVFGSPLNVAATLAGSYMMKRGLGSILGRGGGSGLATMAEDSPSLLARAGSSLGSIWSRFGGLIKGAGLDVVGGAEEVGGTALDATGVGSIGGIPLNVLGAATIAAGTGMMAKNIYNHATATHAQTSSVHAAQVRQQAAQRISSTTNLKNVTIDQLKINNITLPSNARSIFSGGSNSGSMYAPTSGVGNGGGWWGSFTNWIGNLFGGGGSSGATGGGGPINTSANAKQIYSFLTGKGLTPSAASGIMGNLQQESGLNPNEPGGGLAQWINGRQTALQAYAKANGGSPNALNTQLGFLWNELKSGQYGSISALNHMSASQAALYFQNNFEKPNAAQANTSGRESYANQFYNNFTHLSPESATQIGHAVANAFTTRFGMLPGGTGGAVRP